MKRVLILLLTLSLVNCDREDKRVLLDELNCDEWQQTVHVSDTFITYGEVVANLKRIRLPAQIDIGVKNQLIAAYSAKFKNNIFGDSTRCKSYNNIVNILNGLDDKIRDASLPEDHRKVVTKIYEKNVEELLNFLQELLKKGMSHPDFPSDQQTTTSSNLPRPVVSRSLIAHGYVTGEDDKGLESVSISFDGYTIHTDSNGHYEIEFNLRQKKYGESVIATFSKEGYQVVSSEIYVYKQNRPIHLKKN